MMEKIKRKTQSQLEALESFYSEDRYPSRTAMECHAAAFRLTYKQVRGWFVEKRRREKRENKTTEELGGRNGSGAGAPRVVKHCPSKAPSLLRYKQTKMNGNHIQELLTPDYILKKVFRKDGPPLGVEFDSLPSRALFHSTDPEDLHPPCKENQRETKRRKVTEHAVIGHQNCDESAPVKKHGVGKGLMTVWRATNPDARDFPVT